MAEQQTPIKITVVGDGTVGKTFMLYRYANNDLPTDYQPTVFDNYHCSVNIDGNEYDLQLFDTSGQEDYDRIRKLSYTDRDCIIICFAINSSISYQHVKRKWITDIRNANKEAKIVLVGTKADLRFSGEAEVSEEDGVKMMKRIRAKTYIECSALKNRGVDFVISEATKVVIRSRQKKRHRKCEII